MGYARSPTRIFPSVSVGAQPGVVFMYVCTRAWPGLNSGKAMYGAAEVLGDSASNNGRVRD